MNPQEFHQLLSHSCLLPKEMAEAWKLYKGNSPVEAQAFVREIELRLGILRKSATLRDKPIPYQIWGRQFIEQGALEQMAGAARLPVAVAGALMPDVLKKQAFSDWLHKEALVNNTVLDQALMPFTMAKWSILY